MPRDGTRTRTLLLDTAERLVELQGFAATSVDQILAESGSSKGAFFHHFASKQVLADALVDRYVERDLGQLQQGLDAVAALPHDSSAAARALTFVGYYESWADLVSDDTACLYIAVLTERDLLDGATSGVVRAMVEWRRELAALLAPALVEAGSGIDADDLADHLFATFEGAFLMCRALRSADPMRAQLRVFRQLLEAVLMRTGTDLRGS